MRARGEQLGDARDVEALLGEAESGPQSGATGTNHQRVKLVSDNRLATGEGTRSLSLYQMGREEDISEKKQRRIPEQIHEQRKSLWWKSSHT